MTVGDNSIVGLAVFVGSDVVVDEAVGVGSGVSVRLSVVIVIVGAVGVAGCPVEGAQAEANSKINKMILCTLIKLS